MQLHHLLRTTNGNRWAPTTGVLWLEMPPADGGRAQHVHSTGIIPSNFPLLEQPNLLQSWSHILTDRFARGIFEL